MEQAPSAGKTVAIAGLSTGQAIILLLYIVHKFGVDDMTPEVATAIISVAVTMAGAIMHNSQRHTEAKTYSQNTGGTNAGPTQEKT